MRKDNRALFNGISSIYGAFYEKQKKWYRKSIEGAKDKININDYKTVIDIGCGTGAHCSVLKERGFIVTGVDCAVKMLEIGRKKKENKGVDFYLADALEGLHFPDKSFDLSFASYVAHGMVREDRMKLYKEMNRITKEKVIIQDYNKNRSIMTSIIEWMEGGDYFNFIQHAQNEMEEVFQTVEIVDVGIRAAWYICTPKQRQSKINAIE